MMWNVTSFRPRLARPNVGEVNENHATLCPSPEWAAHMHTDVLPGLAAGLELGPRMLEIGPGPGATAEWLRHRVETLVAVEIDAAAADALAERFAGTNVEVRQGDAGALPFDDDSFDSAGSFTMLHHVPTVALQNAVLGEVLRVLRPGGTLIASDSLPSTELHVFHEGDIYNPIDPAGLVDRLHVAGFAKVVVEPRDWKGVAFIARTAS
jgi:SAM-dependent methyltransferase